jgi:hypothetical protein
MCQQYREQKSRWKMGKQEIYSFVEALHLIALFLSK